MRRGLARLLAAALVAGAPLAAQEDAPALALELVNEARAAHDLAPLSRDGRLTAAAEAHAEDMRARDYYAHVSPEGGTVRDRFLAEGGSQWRLVSENIAMCRGCPAPAGLERVRAFQQGWMASPEHRANILDPGLEAFGFGMASGEAVAYGVQTFAGPGRPEGLAPGAAEEPIPPAALSERALEAVNAARQAEGLDRLEARPALAEAAARLTDKGAVRDAEGALSEAVGASDWSSVGMVSGECGGCGTVPTARDVESFVAGWLAEPALAGILLDPAAEALGAAVTASGNGRKGAVALVGRP
jgi:uncharacterized protein YkwD